MNKTRLKKIHLLPNVITAFGLSCGLFVIFKMSMIVPGEATYKNLLAMTGILLLAAFADILDGAVARAMKAESDFGGLFDSLADAISFGVAPSVIVLKTLSIEPGINLSFFIMTASMIFSVCGVLRLVRFNVSALAAKHDEDLAQAQKKHFTGLPIPGAAAAIISLNLLLAAEYWDSTVNQKAWTLVIALILIGYCMISRWKFPSVKTLEVKVSSFQVVFLTVVCAVFIVYGVLHFFPIVFFLLAWGYVIIAWTLAIIRLIAGRKSKTLEEFEPEPDELEE